jgi:hypothetical protein
MNLEIQIRNISDQIHYLSELLRRRNNRDVSNYDLVSLKTFYVKCDNDIIRITAVLKEQEDITKHIIDEMALPINQQNINEMINAFNRISNVFNQLRILTIDVVKSLYIKKIAIRDLILIIMGREYHEATESFRKKFQYSRLVAPAA